MKNTTWSDVLAAVFVLALISLMVRPTSLAPAFITAFGDGMTAVTQFAVSA